MKLHAVAPGGPPEGQCKEEQEQEMKLVHNTIFDDPLPYIAFTLKLHPLSPFEASPWPATGTVSSDLQLELLTDQSSTSDSLGKRLQDGFVLRI